MKLDSEALYAALRVALLAILLVVLALQRGGYYAESWGLPTVACAWVVSVSALLIRRQRLRRLEVTQLGALTVLGLLALVSASWSPGGLGSTLPQAQLIALYVSALAAMLMLFRRATPLLATIGGAVTAVSVVALSARLFTADPSAFDPASSNRLYQPLGYWNSLGLWAAMGICVSVGLVARARHQWLRAAAAASSVPCAVTLYLTFGRAAWAALVIGLVVAILIDPRRLGLIAWLGLTAPWPAAAVILASHSHALTSADSGSSMPAKDARSRIWIAALAFAAAVSTFSITIVERRVRVPLLARQVFAGTIVVGLVLILGGTIHRHGAPWTIAEHAIDRFEAPPPRVHSLNERLFDLSGSSRVDLWRVAWDDARSHPLTGSGAGSYASEWFRERPNRLDVINAHTLYLETLAELGPAGLALLLAGLGAPLVAAWRGRRHPLAAGATAAYVAFLVHVAVDWDWQLASVSVAALACGAALLVTARGSRSPPPGTRSRAVLATFGVVLAGFALWSLHGSYPLGEARDAINDGRWRAAEQHASVAVSRNGGFSAAGWQLLGEAQTALKKPEAARRALRIAVRRDPSSWQAWYELAVVAQGAERKAAARKAHALNPRGPELRDLRQEFGITPIGP